MMYFFSIKRDTALQEADEAERGTDACTGTALPGPSNLPPGPSNPLPGPSNAVDTGVTSMEYDSSDDESVNR